MAIPTDIKERTAADLSAAANDFLSRMAKLGRTASGFLPGLARGMIKAGALRKEDFNVDSPAPDQCTMAVHIACSRIGQPRRAATSRNCSLFS